MNFKFDKYVLFIIKAFCVSCAVYVSIKEVNTYYEDNDISTISSRQFNASPKDKYPTFTICFKGDGIYKREVFEKNVKFIYKETHIKYQYSIKSILSGDFWYNFNINSTLLSSIDPRTYTLKPYDALMSYLERKILRDASIWWYKKEHGVVKRPLECNNSDKCETLSTFPFVVSYQDPMRICFTPNIVHNSSLIRNFDSVELDLDQLKSQFGILYDYEEMSLYLHHPGQLLRNFGKEAIRLVLGDLGKSESGEMITLSIYFISLLRRREDTNPPCNPNLLDEDAYIRQTLINSIGCVPIYWKFLTNNVGNVRHCNSSEQYGKFYNYLFAYEGKFVEKIQEEMHSYIAACEDMTIHYNIQTNKEAFSDISLSPFRMKIQYLSKTYQEIKNNRYWGIESVCTKIGGFLGILLGVSLYEYWI